MHQCPTGSAVGSADHRPTIQFARTRLAASCLGNMRNLSCYTTFYVRSSIIGQLKTLYDRSLKLIDWAHFGLQGQHHKTSPYDSSAGPQTAIGPTYGNKENILK